MILFVTNHETTGVSYIWGEEESEELIDLQSNITFHSMLLLHTTDRSTFQCTSSLSNWLNSIIFTFSMSTIFIPMSPSWLHPQLEYY